MIDILKKPTKDRGKLVNIIICISVILGIIIVPLLISLSLSRIIKDSLINSMVSTLIYIAILFIIYYKDIISEFNITKKSLKEHFKRYFKYYLIGLCLMMIFNGIIGVIFHAISDNESNVRNILFSKPFLFMINISILAPLEEELVYRKSIRTIFDNRILYSIVSGLVFGFAHLSINFLSGTFVVSDLVYLLPYASLGVSFALMVYDSKSTFTSVMFHSIHNTFVGLLLIFTYSLGASIWKKE